MPGLNSPADPHVSDLIPAYALDSLNAAETRQVTVHLAHCPTCQAEFEVYRRVVDDLSAAAPLAAPPPRLKAQLLARLPAAQVNQAAQVNRVAQSDRAAWRSLLARWLPLRPVLWPALTGLLLILLSLGNLWQWQRLRSLPQAPASFRVVSLLGTENAPAASGLLVMDPEGDQGTLVVNALPALDPAHQYQLWLIRDGQRASGGVFSVSSGGYGWLALTSQTPLYQVDGYGITIEPAGGSPGPTGARVLAGKP